MLYKLASENTLSSFLIFNSPTPSPEGLFVIYVFDTGLFIHFSLISNRSQLKIFGCFRLEPAFFRMHLCCLPDCKEMHVLEGLLLQRY